MTKAQFLSSVIWSFSTPQKSKRTILKIKIKKHQKQECGLRNPYRVNLPRILKLFFLAIFCGKSWMHLCIGTVPQQGNICRGSMPRTGPTQRTRRGGTAIMSHEATRFQHISMSTFSHVLSTMQCLKYTSRLDHKVSSDFWRNKKYSNPAVGLKDLD